MKQVSIVVVLVLITAIVGGCASTDEAVSLYQTGDLVHAQLAIESYAANKAGTGDEVYALLEQGAILRAAQDFEASNTVLLQADQAVDTWDQRAEVSVSKEAAAVLTNLNTLPYRGYHYDRIMLSTYRALNYLAMGQIDQARPELIKAYNRQNDAVARNAKRIEEEQAELEAEARQARKEDSGQVDVDRTLNDENVQQSLAEKFADLDKFQAYSDYVNPFCEYLQGIYFLNAGVDGSDYERARVSLTRVLGMVGANPYVKADVEAAERMCKGGAITPTTYVLFESGMAPERRQIRIDLPLFLVNDKVDYVGINLPRLVMIDTHVNALEIRTRTGQMHTRLVCDMDTVIAQEFRNDLSMVIAKTFMAAAAKAAIAYGVNEATDGEETTNLIARLAAGAYQVAMNQADLRTWRTLPKQVQVARMPTPEDRQLTLLDQEQERTVTLKEGLVNVVYVKSIQPGTPLLVSQFKLR